LYNCNGTLNSGLIPYPSYGNTTQPKFSHLQNTHHLFPDVVLTTHKPIKLNFLLLFHIFPNVTRWSCNIRIPQHHFLIKGVRLNGEILTHFGAIIVWDGDDGADRVVSVGDGFTSKDVRVGVIKGVAALAKEGQSKDTVINVKFQSTSGCKRKCPVRGYLFPGSRP
jgi:hypothetical protein